MKPSLADLRENYTKAGLDLCDAHTDPFTQFKIWMDEAVATSIIDPNAMTLATADADGSPSARIVLLKHYDQQGFCFFTNYTSQKGKDLAQNPKASIVFHWKELERQINIRGRVEKVSKSESESYFHMRPHSSQIGAVVSKQSTKVESRDHLLAQEEALKSQFPEGTEIPLPEFWGGYRIIPDYIEFWQGRPSRLHDRIVYTPLAHSSKWEKHRYCP